MFTGGLRFHTAVVVLLIQQLVVVACVIFIHGFSRCRGEYFVVYFRMYIYVRLIMSGYLFFCIYFNVLVYHMLSKMHNVPFP